MSNSPNYLTTPIRATLSSFFDRQKRHFTLMTEKITDYNNDRCHDNFDQYFGNFDDNDIKKITEKPTTKVNVFFSIVVFPYPYKGSCSQ